MYYAMGMLSLMTGYHCYRRLSRHTVRLGRYVLIRKCPDRRPADVLSDVQIRQLRLFCGLVCAFVIYHFWAGGIPALHSDVETARFDFTSSGLMGIPGRMAMFGWPFVVLYVTLYYCRTLDKRVKLLLIGVWSAYAVFSLASGFKSSLVQVFCLLLLARLLLGNPFRLRELLSRRVVAITALSVLYMGWLSYKYASLGISDLPTLLAYAQARASLLAAQPGYLAITSFAQGTTGHSFLLQDLLYFVRKYLKVGLGDPSLFPLDKTVSSAIYNVPLQEGEWIVPVTVGAFAELYVDATLVGTMVLMCLLGAGMAYAVNRCISARSSFHAAAWGMGINTCVVFLVNGNLVYCVINYAAVLAMLALLRLVAMLPYARSGTLTDTHSMAGQSREE